MTKFTDIEHLFRTHYSAMYRLAMLILRNESVARDIVHDVFEALLFSGKSDVSEAYLMTSVRNRCLKHIRSLSVQERLKAAYIVEKSEIEDEDWPDDETIALIQSTVSNDLTETCRRVIEMRFTEKKSYQEIADMYGISKVAVYKHIRHAIDVLREKLFFLTFNRSFNNKHSVMAHVRGLYEHNRTNYYGSVNALDNSATKFGQIGASYSFSAAAVSASFGVGWDWLSTYLNDNKSYSNYPYIDASLRYVPNKKNSFGAVFHYSVWPPSSNYKSENVIHVSPFLWHTGNPVLKSHRCYDIWLNYSFIPSNKFNMNVFAGTYFLGDRAAFVYEATPYGIIRTIQQPIGRFQHYNYGVNVSTNFFNKSLYLSGKVAQLYVRNGKPYNINHTCLSYYMQALYYLGNFNFALTYQSADATDNYESMSGVWTRSKDIFVFQVGWSNRKWNVKMSAQNLQRWNWQASHDAMSSPNYSVDKWISNASRHAFVQLSATYTFGFGKKVSRRDDISRQSGASSGILK